MTTERIYDLFQLGPMIQLYENQESFYNGMCGPLEHCRIHD